MQPEQLASRFYSRLRELRTAKGWTQAQLAERAGMKTGSIANLEQGRTTPAWETIVRLCTALGVKCDEFLQPPATEPPAGPGRPRKEQGPAAPPATKGRKK